VLPASTPTWFDGCPVGRSSLLALTTMAWDSVDVCGWLVWGIRVVRMVASVVVSCPLAGWDVSSARSSFAGLFLGDISCVFCRARKDDGRQCCDLFVER
jgi:hypothetical protein